MNRLFVYVSKKGSEAINKCPFRHHPSNHVRKFSSEANLKRTALYDYHVSQGAKMVPFAGYSMPVQYKESIRQSHLHTRSKCSLFDVSHMLQTKIHGKDRVEFIESLTVADVKGLKEGHSTLSLFTNDSGGIEDDLIITRTNFFVYIVSNAGCRDKDKSIMESQVSKFKSEGKDVFLEYLEDYSLIAIQGPLAASILQTGVSYDLNEQKFMTSRETDVFEITGCRVTRCGYTGEDGFEISIPNIQVEKLVTKLTESKDCLLAGLGVRDSLRLEAGLCLYGNDIDSTTTPVEAVLMWTIPKRRREEQNFPGAGVILKQLAEKTAARKRVGLIAARTGPAARHDSPIMLNGKPIGKVTSGCPSPTLEKNVAMGYVDVAHSKIGTHVSCSIRGKEIPHEVVKMPFVPTKYFT